MCGIGGVRRYGETPITQEEIAILLCSLEARGNHATGIALHNPDGVHIIKNATPAWSFVGEKATKDFLDTFLTPETNMALLHTRFATVGNPMHIPNNHPMYLGKVAVVHNGGISNHTQLFSQLKTERSCETDSDIIRGILDTYGLTEQGIKQLGHMNGSAAIAACSADDPDTLLLARSGSPLVYGMSEDKLWWASTVGAIQKAVRPWVMRHGLWGRKTATDIAYYTMPDHSAYLLTPDGIKYRGPFNVCQNYVAPTYATVHTGYHYKMKGWKEENTRNQRYRAGVTPVVETKPVAASPVVMEPKKVGICPGCGISNWIKVGEAWAGRTCGASTCKHSLGSLDLRGGKA